MKRFKNEVVYKILPNDNINDIENYLKDLGYKHVYDQDKGNYLYTYDSGDFQFLNGLLKTEKIEARSLEEFYAFAAMTDEENGIKGEWWYYNKEYKGFEGQFTVNKIYQQIEPSINDFRALIDNNGRENGNQNLNLKFFRKATVEEIQSHFQEEITFEQFKKYVLGPDHDIDKTNNMKKLIGYKIKPEFKEAYNIISAHDVYNENITINIKSIAVDEFRKLKVLDLWFDPVYEEKFKIGDWVCVINNDRYCKEYKKGEVFQVSNIFDVGGKKYLRYADTGFDIRIENVRKATQEEINRATKIRFKDITAQFNGDLVTFGCTVFTKNEIATLHEFLSRTSYKSKLSVNDLKITPEFLQKILDQF